MTIVWLWIALLAVVCVWPLLAVPLRWWGAGRTRLEQQIRARLDDER